jgi:hypothetical protein
MRLKRWSFACLLVESEQVQAAWDRMMYARPTERCACESKHVTARLTRRCALVPALVFIASHCSCHSISFLPYPRLPNLRLLVSGCSDCKIKDMLDGVESMEQYFRTRASVDDDPDLARNRRANDARLKSRFEHIFTKYGRDFDGVGDEIDLETGRIVVNNGHIARMQHEVDPGQRTSAQVLRVLGASRQGDSINITRGEEPVIEDSVEDTEDDEELAITGTSGYISSDNDIENGSEGQSKPWPRAPDELSSDFYPIQDATPRRSRPTLEAPAQHSAARRQLEIDQAVKRPRAASRSESPDNPSMELPFLRDSMKAMRALPDQRGSVDPDVIQALGQSIANQLAKFMTGDTKKPRRKTSHRERVVKDTRWEYPLLPGDRIDRTPSPSLPGSPSAALFATSPDREASVWAPQARRGRKRSKMQSQILHSTAVDNDDDDDTDDNDDVNPLQSDPPSHIATTIGDEAEGILDIDCYNCGATNSRVWRTGPGGRLCDSCGTYYRRYGLLKAVEDPSFTPAPRTGQGRYSVHDQNLPTYQDTDIFAIPTTDVPDLASGHAANTARRVTGDGRNGRFTLEEEESIIRHHEIDQLSWDHIGYLLSLRSAYSVHSHYQKFLKAPGCEARRRLLDPKVRARTFETEGGASRRRVSVAESEDARTHDISDFAEREDELIIRLREDERMTWEQIATYFPDRTSHALQAHYNEILFRDEPISPASEPKGHALEVDHMQRTIDNDSPSSLHSQTKHHLRIARQTIDDDFAGPEGYNSNANGTNATLQRSHSFTSEEDVLILQMRDEKSAAFREMTPLFRDRTEEALVDRYIHLKARLASSAPNLIAGTSVAPEIVDTTTSGVADGPDSLYTIPAPNLDTRTQMPPPHVLSRRAGINERYHYEGPTMSAGGSRAQHLRTPSFHARQISVPPGPSEVGPSAWATTQPASKGPLPFQPARKGLVPKHPKSASRGLQDPFISKTNASEGPTLSQIQNEYDMTGATRSVSKPRPQSAKAESRYHALAMANQHSVLPELMRDLVPQSDKLSDSVPCFTSEQDKFIKKAREKRRLAWAEIADTLPGDVQHTASAIMHRYYDFLLGKRSATTTNKPQEAPANRNHGKPRTEEESDRASWDTQQQGTIRNEIANKMSELSPISSENRFQDPKPKAARQQLATHQRHSSKPLLRRALKNSTRRNSDVVNTGILPEDQSPLGQDPDRASSDHSSLAFGPHQLHPHSHPEVVISSGEVDDLDDGSSKPSTVKTVSGARSRVQHKPDLIARVSDPTTMHVDRNQPHGQANGREAVSSNEMTLLDEHVDIHQPETYTDDSLGHLEDFLPANNDQTQDAILRPVQEPQSAKKVSSSGTKRKRRSGRLHRVSDVEVADSDSDTPVKQDQSKEIHDVAHATPQAKRGRGRPRKSGLFFSGAFSHDPMLETEHAQAVISKETSPKLRSGLTHPTVPGGADGATKSAPQPNSFESHSALHESTNPTDGGQDGHELRFHTWEQILLAAFRSQPGVALRCRDMAAWVRAHSAHYRHTTEPWIHHLYNEAYRNPAFEKAHPRKSRSGWILVGSNIRAASTEQVDGDVGNNTQVDPTEHSIAAEQTFDDAANEAHVVPGIRPTSVEHPDISEGAQGQVGTNIQPTLAEHPGHDNVVEGRIDCSISPVSAESSDSSVGSSESIENDELAGDLPTPASPSSRPTDTSTNVVEVIDISSGSPIKKEPASEGRTSTTHPRLLTKRSLNVQEQSSRAKHVRYSDPALVRQISALVTPARSSVNSGRLSLHAHSTNPIKFEPLFGEEVRASPAACVGMSGRRVVVATEVARDDGAEQDELS